ncbi:MAG: peptidase S10, partial [Fimbriimonas ginsengisoli]|nr:peptidase S10 [Fimbriimonas ginsengisoli]
MRALALLLALGLPLAAQSSLKSDPVDKAVKGEEPPSVTRHTWKSAKGSMAYTATTGYLPLKNDKDEVEARIFYVAYTQDNAGADRPLTFAFNGGPGSSSIWLHMGGLGPKRPALRPDGQLAPPPYRAEDNPASWLEFTDLVFIDPVGTGLSRAEKPEFQRKFWTFKGDV